MVTIVKNGSRFRVEETASRSAPRQGVRGSAETASVTRGSVTSGVGPTGASQSTAYLLGADLKDSMLEGIIDTSNPHQLQALYRDIYFSDHICGAAVDLKSTMPWSKFTLSGGDDDQLEVFLENLERMNMQSLLYELSVDKFVSGAYLGILVFDPQLKGFSDMINLNIADCEATPTPLYSEDPIFKLNIPKEFKSFCNDSSESARRIQKKIPANILQAFRSAAQVELSNIGTLYLPRSSLSTLQGGHSIYRRVIPIYLLERMLYRGTLTELSRRQRSTLHIQAGSDAWIPSENELSDLVGLFQTTESDPISSVIATRNDIQVSEVRCLSGFTEINTPNGIVWLKDIVKADPEEMDEGTEVKLQDFYARNQDNEYAKVDSWIYQGYKQTNNYVFDNGATVVSTENHKYLTIGHNLSRRLTTGKNLTCDVWVLSNTRGTHLPKDVINQNCDQIVTVPHDLDYGVYRNGGYSKLIDRISLISTSVANRLVWLLEHEFSYTRVLFVTPNGKEHVYDLHMDEAYAPLFSVQGGIIVKNSAGEFVKWTDFTDQFASMKYKILNINESFMTGDSTYSNVETALSVFMEDLQAQRDADEQSIFYDKIFPLISQIHGFERPEKVTRGKKEETAAKLGYDIQSNLNDRRKYLIPRIHWLKQLRPTADSSYIDMLSSLTDKGVPVPLRLMAAAGGLDYEQLMTGLAKDAEDRKEVEKFFPKDSSGGGWEGASVNDVIPPSTGNILSPRPLGLTERNFAETDREVYERGRTGKRKYVHNQKKAQDRINDLACKALRNLSDPNAYEAALQRVGRTSKRNK